jgi:aerobic C4-dicarboxylate transport protein
MAQIATEQAPNRGRRPWYGQLYVQVLVAILAGALIGYFQPGLAVQLKPLAMSLSSSSRWSSAR